MSYLTSRKVYKTGQQCPQSAVWKFAGYVDGSQWPPPKPEERDIPLSKGEIFPPIRSAAKAAWWRFYRDA